MFGFVKSNDWVGVNWDTFIFCFCNIQTFILSFMLVVIPRSRTQWKLDGGAMRMRWGRDKNEIRTMILFIKCVAFYFSLLSFFLFLDILFWIDNCVWRPNIYKLDKSIVHQYTKLAAIHAIHRIFASCGTVFDGLIFTDLQLGTSYCTVLNKI